MGNIKHNHTTHKSVSTTYRSWAKMKQRCLNINNDNYSYYGGRGIKICNEWLIFDNFLKDMGIRPEGTTLDRINVEGNYCKENCRWSNKKVQRINSRGNLKSTSKFKGVSWSSAKKKWLASIHINRKTKNLGYYDQEIEAAKVYNEAALKIYGENAYLNSME